MTDRSSVALRQSGPRGTAGTDADGNALENVITAELSDGAEAYLVGNRSGYRFKLGDESTPLLGDRIVPTPLDAGRWIEQGGEYTLQRVLTTELAADVLVGAGLTVELLRITVQDPDRCFLTMLGDLSATWTNTGDLELQVFVSVDGGAFTEVNAGAVQSAANTERRVVSVGATSGPFPTATQTIAVSLRLRNGLASDVTVSPAGGNNASLRVQMRRASVSTIEPGILWFSPTTFGSAPVSYVMVAYLPNQLALNVSPTPLVAIMSPGGQNRPYRFRADPTDPTKVWIMHAGVGTTAGAYLCRHSRDQLGQDGVPAPEVICELNPVRTSANFAIDFVFVPGINKCVVATLGTIRVYDIASLVSGTPVPTAVITVAGATTIQGLLVDGNDVWVSSYAGSFVFKLTAAQLQGAGGVTVPPIILTGANFAGGVEYIEFGPDGALWVTFYDVNQFRKYSAASIAVSGNPAPLVSIDITSAATGAYGIFINDNGDVFVSSYDNGDLYKFLNSQVQTSGNKAPTAIFNTQGLVGSGGVMTLDRGVA
jgi:hypothetical protein